VATLTACTCPAPVLDVKGNQVRIGVGAPKSVAVHREEIYERIQREQAPEKSTPYRFDAALSALGRARDWSAYTVAPTPDYCTKAPSLQQFERDS